MKPRSTLPTAAALVLTVSAPAALAQSAAVAPAKAVFAPVAELKWIGAGVPGVETAVVKGDMAQGASHFYLKYPAGFVAPVHHHSPDHYVTTVAGNLVLVVDGKEHRLPPGSYFAFTGRAKHAARCEGAEACVMFIDARGKWDVVLTKANDAK
jgi:quercetin dioxygenase-like cupin family protein